MKRITKNILQNIGKLLVKHGGILSFCTVITIVYSHITNLPFYIGILLGFAAYFFINIGVSSFKFIADECEGKNKEEPTNNATFQEQINTEEKQPKRRRIRSIESELNEPDHVDEKYLQSFLQKCNTIPEEKSAGVVDISSALNMDSSFSDEDAKELLFSNLSGE